MRSALFTATACIQTYALSLHDALPIFGTVGLRNTGTTVHFWPDPGFFDSPKFTVPKLKHVLRAKAVLCPGLRSEEHTSELQSPCNLVCRLLLEKTNT